MATIRKKHNIIRKIKDAQGNWFEDQQGIMKIITKKFENRFKSDPSCNQHQAIPMSVDVSDMDNVFLTREVLDQEIHEDVKQLSPLKASSLDGMLAIFYQKNWDIVGKQFVEWLDRFFTQATYLRN